MEVTDSAVRYAQVAVSEISSVLLSLADRLETVASGIRQPPDLDAMLDGEIPLTVAVDLREAIECALVDHLRPAVERLARAARATPESLLEDFLDRRDGAPVSAP